MKLFIIIIALFSLTGCKNERLDIKTTQEFIANDSYSENISMESSIVNNSLILFITNNNKETIDIDIKVEFYNKKDKVVSTEEDIFSAILDKKELAVIFDIYKEYEYYKIYLESEKSSFISYEDKITITEDNVPDEYKIDFNILNNAEDVIEYIELAIVFYRDDLIVGFDSNYATNLKSNGNIVIKFAYPHTSDYKPIEYDNYKIYINEACTYNDNE